MPSAGSGRISVISRESAEAEARTELFGTIRTSSPWPLRPLTESRNCARNRHAEVLRGRGTFLVGRCAGPSPSTLIDRFRGHGSCPDAPPNTH